MSSKLTLAALIILFSGWIVAEGYLKPIPAQAESTQESHGVKEHTKEHKGVALHRAEGHEEAGAHGEESWWRFPGWQIVFAAIGCLYFALVLAWLPLLVAKRTEGGHH